MTIPTEDRAFGAWVVDHKVLPLLDAMGCSRQTFDAGPEPRLLERHCGDVVAWFPGKNTPGFIEVKGDRTEYRTLYLETWVQRTGGKKAPGWMQQVTHADWLAYYWVQRDELVLIPHQKLRAWAYDAQGAETPAFQAVPERPHTNNRGRAWGRCIEPKEIAAAIGSSFPIWVAGERKTILADSTA